MPCLASSFCASLRTSPSMPGQHLFEEFDHGDLGAEAAPDRAEFEPDHSAADHDEVFGNGVKRQRAGAVDDHALVIVDVDAGEG